MQNRDRLQAHRAPDDDGAGALVYHYAGAGINLDFDGLDLIEQSRQVLVWSRNNLHAAAVDGMGALRAQRAINGRRHALGGMEVGIVENHADDVQLLQFEWHWPLHQRSPGNPAPWWGGSFACCCPPR